MTNVVYFVHQLDDEAVERRVRMLAPHIRGSIVVMGFFRGDQAPATVGGARAIGLGRTEHARLAQRVVSVLTAIAGLHAHRRTLADADLVIARFVETLAIAIVARRLYCSRGVPIVYECLDVHQIMASDGMVGRTMRAIETFLLRRCSGLIVSSPAFLRRHFDRLNTPLPRVWVVENKVLESEVEIETRLAQRTVDRDTDETAWRIGWFGNIRCSRSLNLLVDLCRNFPELVEVVIAGRVSDDQIPNFHDLVASVPNIHFRGLYDRVVDLPAIYGEVDFAWALDFMQEGANSDWLLPNRLYEGPLYGAVPLALRGTQTGDWLAARRAGVLLSDPLESTLSRFVREMTMHELTLLRASIEAIPLDDLVCGLAEERSLARELLDLT